MKFLTFAILPTLALAQAPTKTKVDEASLTHTLDLALLSAGACSLSMDLYLDQIKSESSIETGCIWFETNMMPPVEAALNNRTYSTTELAALEKPLTILTTEFDYIVGNMTAEKTKGLIAYLCKDVFPGKNFKEGPKVGDTTVRVLKKFSTLLNDAGLLSNIATQLTDIANKLAYAHKLALAECSGGSGSGSAGPTGTGCVGSPAPAPTATGPPIVHGAGSGFAPKAVLVSLVAAAGAVFML